MLNRRDLIKRLTALPLLGGVAGSFVYTRAAALTPQRDYFKELGVRTFINAAGTYTAMTGSLMHEEVLAAIQYAS